MLYITTNPQCEIYLSGEGAAQVVEYLRKRFALQEIYNRDKKNVISSTESTWWDENRFRRLAGARLKADLTQERLAALSGLAKTTICLYERGKRKISKRAAEKLGKALKISPDLLLG